MYKYYSEENIIDFDNESVKTDSSYDETKIFVEINQNRIIFQKSILDNLSILPKDSYTQTIWFLKDIY